MDWGPDKGAVTAELMVLMPTVAIGIGVIGSVLGLVSEQLTLEQDAGYLLRSHLIGNEIDATSELEVEFFQKGRLSCISISKQSLLTLRTAQCGIPIA